VCGRLGSVVEKENAVGYALLGHGGLELAAGGYPEGMGVVAIDAGTTLQVYTDSGQSLLMGEDDYELFSKLQAPWAPMDSRNVTYNLELTENADDLELEKNEPGFFNRVLAPHTPLLAGREVPSPALLCTGTPQTCPTDPRMITGQVAGPRAHSCTGILGAYKGELLWVACTVVYTKDKGIESVVDAARGSAPESAVPGTNPDIAAETWYALERDDPDGLEEWFDEQANDVQQTMLTDPHIADWNTNR